MARRWIQAPSGRLRAGNTAPAAGPGSSIALATDKALYQSDEQVRIDTLVRNLMQNAHIDDARVELTVTDPGGAAVFTRHTALGQLAAASMRALGTVQPLQNAAAGEYTVTALLFGSGDNIKSAPASTGKAYLGNVQLARASVRYRVQPFGSTGAGDLAGTLTLAQDSIPLGAAQSRSDAVRNTSQTDYPALQIIRVLAAEGGREIWRDEQTIALPAGAQHTWPPTPIATAALVAGRYDVLLLAEVNGQTRLLAQKAFRIMAQASSSGDVIHQVPALPPAALTGLALALMAAAAAARRRMPATRARGAQESP